MNLPGEEAGEGLTSAAPRGGERVALDHTPVPSEMHVSSHSLLTPALFLRVCSLWGAPIRRACPELSGGGPRPGSEEGLGHQPLGFRP